MECTIRRCLHYQSEVAQTGFFPEWTSPHLNKWMSVITHYMKKETRCKKRKPMMTRSQLKNGICKVKSAFEHTLLM